MTVKYSSTGLEPWLYFQVFLPKRNYFKVIKCWPLKKMNVPASNIPHCTLEGCGQGQLVLALLVQCFLLPLGPLTGGGQDTAVPTTQPSPSVPPADPRVINAEGETTS